MVDSEQLIAKSTSRDSYDIRNDAGDLIYTMSREYHTFSNNGNKFSGQWVMRDSNNSIVDFNAYRHDIFSHYNITIRS